MIHDFAECVCTGYTPLMCAQASTYRARLNALLGDVKVRGEYLGGFCVHLREAFHSFHIWDEDSENECSGRTPPSESGDGGDVVVVLPLSARPMYLTLLSISFLVVKWIYEF